MLVSKHKDTVSQSEREKSDLLAAHARKVSHLEANKLTEIERLNETHRRALDEVRSEHLAEMNHLKKMKEQEISATVTAFSHTKSLQGLMEQVLNSTKQVCSSVGELMGRPYNRAKLKKNRNSTIHFLARLHEHILCGNFYLFEIASGVWDP